MYMYQGFSLQFQVWNMGLREACDGKMRSQAPPRAIPGVHTGVHTRCVLSGIPDDVWYRDVDRGPASYRVYDLH
jgi:hypothetical protein